VGKAKRAHAAVMLEGSSPKGPRSVFHNNCTAGSNCAWASDRHNDREGRRLRRLCPPLYVAVPRCCRKVGYGPPARVAVRERPASENLHNNGHLIRGGPLGLLFLIVSDLGGTFAHHSDVLGKSHRCWRRLWTGCVNDFKHWCFRQFGPTTQPYQAAIEEAWPAQRYAKSGTNRCLKAGDAWA
jgi:hypothetical protein